MNRSYKYGLKCILATVFLTVCVLLSIFFYLSYSTETVIKMADILDAFSQLSWLDIVKTSGVIIALLALTLAYRQFNYNKELDSDKTLVDLIRLGYEDSYKYISDNDKPVNSRERWIRAARHLTEVQDLVPHLKTNQYKTAHKIIEDQWRFIFSRLLRSDPKYGTLRPQFFYGIENWDDSELSLDQAYDLSGGHCVGNVGMVNIWELHPDPKLKILERRSIEVICKFALIPKNRSYLMDERAASTVDALKKDFIGSFDGVIMFLEHDEKMFLRHEKMLKQVPIKTNAEVNKSEVEKAKKIGESRRLDDQHQY